MHTKQLKKGDYRCDVPSAVIVTFFGGERLKRCVEALEKQSTPPRDIHIIVSNPAPIDLPSGVRTTRLARATHFAAAANIGLKCAKGRPVVLLNDDTVPAVDFIARLVEAVDEPGIYQPCIMLADGSETIDNTGHRLFFDGFNIARERGQAAPSLAQHTGAFSGAAVLFTPEVLDTVGLFDSNFEAFGEDLDLSLRARRAGFQIRFVPRAIIHHELGASYGRISHQKLFWVERNRTRAAVRSLPLTALALLPMSTALRLAAQGVGAMMGRGVGAGVGPKGWLSVLAGNGAGALGVASAWRKRCRDRPHWQAHERDMLHHLITHRIRRKDLFSRI
jgi:GT2 family glycosyltransferase